MPHPKTISITMAAEMHRAVQESVEAGEYISASDAVNDAVRVWQRERAQDRDRLTSIKSRIRRSLNDPRPDLSSEDVDAALADLFAAAREEAGRA